MSDEVNQRAVEDVRRVVVNTGSLRGMSVSLVATGEMTRLLDAYSR